MYRRQFLTSSAALAGSLAAFPLIGKAATPPVGTRSLTVSTRSLDIDGKPATVYGLTSESSSGFDFAPGEAFSVDLHNRLSEPTIIHWHGLTPPVEQDGVPNNPLPMLASGENRTYAFPIETPGTHWMHAHTLQHQNLLSAPLIVHSHEDMAEDRQQVVIMLHDFSFRPAEELLADLTGGKSHGMHHGAMNHDGMDSMDMGDDMDAIDMQSMDMSGMEMPMDLNDINYDAYLANDRTLSDPEIVRVEKGGRIRLRIINGAASTAFTISTGELLAELVAVDGQPTRPVKGRSFPMTMGQRIDLLIDLPGAGGAFPILALREGAPERTGIVLASSGSTVSKVAVLGEDKGPVLDLAMERGLQAIHPLSSRGADRRYMVHLGGDMASYRWTMMGAKTISAKPGERVEIAMMNMSMMAHPMHLHGHHFQVVDIDGERLQGALRDTVLVPPMKTVTIAFDAGSPGKWAFHCHHLYHMVSGMMVHLKIG